MVGAPGVFLEIATTRPETIMGDTAVAVNPRDQRYAHLIGGEFDVRFRSRIRPCSRSLATRRWSSSLAPVSSVTPAHDKTDYEIGLRHGSRSSIS